MNKKKTTTQLMREFMNNLEGAGMNETELKIIYDNLNDIVESAKEQVIVDAENAISKLRIFSAR